jgi:hypothetical protein
MRVLLRAVAVVSWVGLACGGDDGNGETAGTATQAATTEETGGDSNPLGCAAGAVGETTDGAMDPLMETWGAPCGNDNECVMLLGEGAICETEAVIYELPLGYCTKPCTLPDTNTRVVPDDPDCDPDGGVACIGSSPLFQRCALLCTDDAQCNRDGYICRRMPLIAQDTDPKACLMPDCCEGGC